MRTAAIVMVLAAVLASGSFLAGWTVRGNHASGRIQVLEENLSGERERSVRWEETIDSLEVAVEDAQEAVDSAPVPAPVPPTVITRVDSVIVNNVSDTVIQEVLKEAVREAVEPYVAANDSLRTAVAARDSLIALLYRGTAAKDSLLVSKDLQLRLHFEQILEYEVLLNKPWWKSDVAISAYSIAGTSAVYWAAGAIKKGGG